MKEECLSFPSTKLANPKKRHPGSRIDLDAVEARLERMERLSAQEAADNVLVNVEKPITGSFTRRIGEVHLVDEVDDDEEDTEKTLQQDEEKILQHDDDEELSKEEQEARLAMFQEYKKRFEAKNELLARWRDKGF